MKDLQAYINNLLQQAKEGDQNALIMLYNRMCTFLTAIHMNKYVKDNLLVRDDINDIKQQYYFNFIKSLDKFDTSTDKTFISYQKSVIENLLVDFYKRKQLINYHYYNMGIRNTSLDELLDDTENIYQPSHTITPEHLFEIDNDVKMVHDLLDTILTPIQKYVYVQWTAYDKTLEEIRTEVFDMGLSEKKLSTERIRQIYNKAEQIIKKLRG